MRTRHLLGTAVALATALSAVVAVPGAGAATVTAHAATRASKPRLELLAASHDWVVYSAYGKLRAKPVGGGRTVAIPHYDGREIAELTGDFLIYNGARTRTWLNLRTGATGPIPKAHRWPWTAPDGGVFLGPGTDGKLHGFEQNAISGKVTDFGALPGFSKSVQTREVETDETGIVFEQYLLRDRRADSSPTTSGGTTRTR